MKNILLWAGIAVLAFQNQLFSRKTDTFIAGNDEPFYIDLLGKLFTKKKTKYVGMFGRWADVWNFNGGVKNGGFTVVYMSKSYRYAGEEPKEAYELYMYSGKQKYYDDPDAEKAFGSNEFYFSSFREGDSNSSFFGRIMSYANMKIIGTEFESSQEWENIKNLFNHGEEEMALIILSGVKGIKKILS